MRYSYDFKVKCVEMYRQGKWMDTPEGIKERNFHDTIRKWTRLEEANGSEVLKHPNQVKNWNAEEKFALVSQVLSGKSYKSVAYEVGMEHSVLYQWVRKYKMLGYNGLVSCQKGRPSKKPMMKKENTPRPITESEREELIRLRAENEYIKAENEVIKKQIALRHEKWAAQLKAKKQQSLKNSVKKDTH